MSNPANKQSVRAVQKNALQRLDQIEQDFGSLVQGIQGAFGQLDQRVGSMNEITEALVDLFGAEQVNAKIQETRDTRATENAAKAKDALAKAVTEGKYAVSEVVSENSVLTGVESDKDGVALKPGYVQLVYGAIKPEFQEKIKGQKVGFKFDTTEGGSFEITGIFDAVPQKEEEKAADAPAAPAQE